MIIRNRKAGRSLRRGIAAVELAMLTPLLFFMFLVVWDYSRVFYYAVVMTQCSRNGARWAGDPNYFNNPAVATDPYTSVTAAALADAKNITPTPTVTDPPIYGTDANGNPYTQVTVTYQFTTVVNYSFPGLFTIPNTVSLSRTSQMRVAPVLPSGL
jgi:Flp pilus assembly protein TadG